MSSEDTQKQVEASLLLGPIDHMLRLELPDAEISWELPNDHERGTHHCDVRQDGELVVVEVRSNKGIGVSLLTGDDGYGMGPDRVFPFDELPQACVHVRELFLALKKR